MTETDAVDFFKQLELSAERADSRLRSIFSIARELGIMPTSEQRILDFGSGKGMYTLALRRAGLQAFGCDVVPPSAEASAECEAIAGENVYAQVSLENYRLPYPDASFDFIFSDHVLEHVLDYPATLREMRRVLRRGGVALHIFPSRYRVIESHIKTPFAGFLRLRVWLAFWHLFGAGGFIKNQTASYIRNWMNTRVNYLSKRELTQEFSAFFTSVRFVEDAEIRAHKVLFSGILGPLFSTFHVRVVALSYKGAGDGSKK